MKHLQLYEEYQSKYCIEQLKDFLDSKRNNIWLQDDDMSVYVRKASRYIDGQRLTSLDIASINVYKPGNQLGSKFINDAHKMHPFQITCIESIINRRFYDYLRNNGWLQFGTPNINGEYESLIKFKNGAENFFNLKTI